VRKKALTKDERKIQIITWFAIRIQHDNDEYASSYEIAGGLGLSPSTHLRNIINELVPTKLEKIKIERSGRWDGWGYRLARGTFDRPRKSQRALVINCRGITQTAMFDEQ